MHSSSYPVVDLFAGPGGLGEGFSSLTDDQNQNRFKSVASIEKEEFSHRTLLLRHFVRSFPNEEIPDDYYNYLKGNIEIGELFGRHEAAVAKAQKCALRICLGSENHATVNHLIENRLAGAKRWVLVGGPPCQAYSLVGRSRMMGTPGFEEDERHFLYKEYLRIIVDHKPPIFVMENVKGLLSSKIKDQLIIRRIVSDLSRPSAAVKEGRNDLSYRLYSLCHAEPISENDDPRLFIVKAEQHGVPQARHRMFIVGLRADINARPNQLRRQHPPTVSQTIRDLPTIRSGLSKATDSFDSWQQAIAELAQPSIHPQLDDAPFAKQVFERVRLSISSDGLPESRFSTAYPTDTNAEHDTLRSLRDDRLSVLIGHDSRAHMPSDLRRYMYASVFAQVTGRSPKLGDLPCLSITKSLQHQTGPHRQDVL